MTRYALVATLAELVAEPPKARSTETAFRSVTLSELQRWYAVSEPRPAARSAQQRHPGETAPDTYPEKSRRRLRRLHQTKCDHEL